jgi:flagellar basal-body rod protein FlgB
MPINLFDGTMEGLSRALTLRQRQHEVLASNLANIETPGYRARDLDFGAALKEAFAATDGGEAVAPPARIVEDTAVPPRADGNTVDIDLQMVKLSANAGAYTTLARLLKDEFNDLRMAIEGR